MSILRKTTRGGVARNILSGSISLAACLLGWTTLMSTAQAQSADRYPERPVRLVVPFAAGGATDVLARLISHKLSTALGQQIVVENRPGVNGNLGTDAVAKSAPDGYVLVLVADGTVAINPSLYSKLPYNPEKDLVPISRVALLSLILVAHPSLKADSLQELIALGKAPSSNLYFSSAGPGSTGHLAGELLKSRTGMHMTHVAYKGGGQAVNDVVSGQVPLLVTGLSTAGPFISGKQLKAIAVTAGKRSAGAPTVPTIAESGVEGFDVASWYAVMAPAGTPQTIVEKLHREIVKALQDPELKATMQTIGAEPIGDTPAEFAEVLHEDLARWKRVVHEANIKFE
ncbi:Bug family tripartite tricarboxylate transporter substrate binding protein [Rhodoplanes sp. Z2-YC6860]|uniref:Bug family tripartite tricarboxylate transporter substrate binding protein n=1 Tax=Rhodoplanes sp. Z2-YC6860 TaxID=674703 RepID=UPI00078D61F5|nr:tripartite tricarboxylate transporter substrate binding protein [Rhodoplanes sp. Z2-YC6860]AMN38525.1 ABC transporter substrate-binding protein [Rhodoplanes sp. Z2-YC6860]